MVKKKREIIWDTRAVDSLKEAYLLIKKESPPSAKKVVQEIRDTIKLIASDPEIFEQDRFKNNNDGSYRAFEKYSYRIVYKFTENKILVLRVRHSSREPLIY